MAAAPPDRSPSESASLPRVGEPHLSAAPGGGNTGSPAQLTSAARDRLEVLPEPGVGPRSRPGRVPQPDVPPPVPCTYCRAPVPAEAFTYWSSARKVVSAPCPQCRRQVTILAVTWRRLTDPNRIAPTTPPELGR